MLRSLLVCILALNTISLYADDHNDNIPPSTPYQVTVIPLDFSTLEISWIGSGDDDREGQALSYELRHGAKPILNEALWAESTRAHFNQTRDRSAKYIQVVVEGFKMADEGYFAIRAKDDAGNLSAISKPAFFKIEDPFTFIAKRTSEDFSDARMTGNEADGRELFACIGWFKGNVYPGKYGTHLRGCNISHAGKEVQAKIFRFITSENSGEWSASTSDEVPDGSINFGYKRSSEYSYDLYLCRSEFKEGNHTGYIQEGIPGCSISWGGITHQVQPYQTLLD